MCYIIVFDTFARQLKCCLDFMNFYGYNLTYKFEIRSVKTA